MCPPAPHPALPADHATRLQSETKKRRTFAIISHPDAGKTTLTEKLLLYGGAIHLAGAVKAKKSQKHTTSDWMEIEKQRGISISTTVLQFPFQGFMVNLLDTPGHKDFSEDTYRTLMAVDAAVMLIDAAKGVEPQTRKLFEVCRLRGIPIFTFINKMDRPSRAPLDIIDELEKVLGIRSCPMTWPIGSGDEFRGVFDRNKKELLIFQTEGEANVKGRLRPSSLQSLDRASLLTELEQKGHASDEPIVEQFLSELELVDIAGDAFDLNRIHRGELSPVFFGSAMNNFGIERFLETFLGMAPEPQGRENIALPEEDREYVEPTSAEFSGFVFKIQANMDPQHRDRVAFLRVCSGKFERNIIVKNRKLERDLKLSMPMTLFGQERIVVEEAWPGDVIGLVDTSGGLRIGETYSASGKIIFPGMPVFMPEYFSGILLRDPMKRKQLEKGLIQLTEEGVVQLYRPLDGNLRDPILAAVGALQFEVFQHRLLTEYSVEVRMEPLGYSHARWIIGEFPTSFFDRRDDSRLVLDRDGRFVALFKSEWALRWTQDNLGTGAVLSETPT